MRENILAELKRYIDQSQRKRDVSPDLDRELEDLDAEQEF